MRGIVLLNSDACDRYTFDDLIPQKRDKATEDREQL